MGSLGRLVAALLALGHEDAAREAARDARAILDAASFQAARSTLAVREREYFPVFETKALQVPALAPFTREQIDCAFLDEAQEDASHEACTEAATQPRVVDCLVVALAKTAAASRPSAQAKEEAQAFTQHSSKSLSLSQHS